MDVTGDKLIIGDDFNPNVTFIHTRHGTDHSI